MRDKIKIDLTTWAMVEVVHPTKTGNDIIETPCNHSFSIPRWNGESWEEGATQEYIDNLKAQAELQEPTVEERLQALETMELEIILGGGF